MSIGSPILEAILSRQDGAVTLSDVAMEPETGMAAVSSTSSEVARSDHGLERLPLAVDLDGTLHRGDLSWWSLRVALWLNPWRAGRALRLPRAAAKQALAAQVLRHFDAYYLKWNTEFESWLDQQGAMDRTLVLASGSDHEFVRRVGAEFDYFSAVIGSDGVTNLTGDAKAQYLTNLVPDGFVYAGNSQQDWPVWQAAKGAVLVNCSPALEARAREAFAIEAVFS